MHIQLIIRREKYLILLLLALFIFNATPTSAKRKQPKDTAAVKVSPYHELTGRDSLSVHGIMNVIHKGNDYYLEMPVKLMGKQFLVSNKLQQVPKELNEAGVNKGVNYENQVIRFEIDKAQKKVLVRQQRLTPEAPSNSSIARSVKDNYIDPLIASLKIDAMPKDSSSVIFKVNDLFNGQKNCLNDVFNLINLGTSANSDLSRILSIKSFERSIVATSELTTIVHEDKSKTNVSVVVSSAIYLLPEKPMKRRK